jgi:ubiquinol-cytochrome c reductase cytochrome c subunit
MKTICRHSWATFPVVAMVLILIAPRARVQAGLQTSKTSGATAGNAENGKKLFKKDGCYECHGLQGQGSLVTGPRLAPDPIPLGAMVNYIREPTGEMPPYSNKVVSDKELADIYAFLQSVTHPPAARTIPLLK